MCRAWAVLPLLTAGSLLLASSAWGDCFELNRRRFVISGKGVPHFERFTCEPEGIRFYTRYGDGSQVSVHLVRATDGSLVVRRWDSLSGPFIAMAERLWYRFTPVNATPAP